MTTISILIGLAIYIAVCWLCWNAGMLETPPQPEEPAADDAAIDSIRGAISSDDTGAYIRRVQRESRKVRAGVKS